MGYKLLKQQMTPKIAEGTYKAIISSIDYKENCTSKYGSQNRLYITFKTDCHLIVRQSYNAVVHDKSHLGKLIKNLLRRLPEEDFDTDELLEKRCIITVEHFTDDKEKTYSNVIEVRPEIIREITETQPTSNIFEEEE